MTANDIVAELKKLGKNYEFHRYDGAGHGFFYWHRPLYRPEQAMAGWSSSFSAVLSRTLLTTRSTGEDEVSPSSWSALESGTMFSPV